MKFIYPAVFRKTEQGTYEGYFPDLDQCRATGETLDDAIEAANEAAMDWITLELEDSDSLPAVTDIRDIVPREGEIVRHISVNYKFTEGWEECPPILLSFMHPSSAVPTLPSAGQVQTTAHPPLPVSSPGRSSRTAWAGSGSAG